MKVVIPLAGFGTRLRPHTFTKPKPLINVAGKPVLGHVLDMFQNIKVDEFIFITGYLGDQIEHYVGKNYPQLKACYFEQKEMNGQSTAVYLARDRLNGPMLIAFVDTIVETDLAILEHETADAVAWVMQVDDPRRFGVAILGPDGYVEKLIEKPSDIRDNLVVVGFYYLKDSQAFMRAIEEQIARNIKTKNEYFLADALQIMLDQGMKMRVQPVEVWEDCGKPETVLHANRYLLDHGRDNSAEARAWAEGSILVPPVHIDPSARLSHSLIGPHVTIAAGCKVEYSIIRDSIIDEDATIQNAMLATSLIGKDARLNGKFRTFNIGDSSEVGFE
jgi:glucose-1-phosphate thymidylyltransferase